MIHEPADERMGYVSTEDFFAVKRAPGFQDPGNFTECPAPSHYVVDGTEVKNGVISRIDHRNMPCISIPEQWPAVFFLC